MKQQVKDPIHILALIVLITFAFNLRSPLTALSPIINELQTDLNISAGMVGMLTTVPILCFGLLTPFASAFIEKAGIEGSILTSLGVVIIGTCIRSLGGFPFTLTGTLIIGIALTIGNIVSLMMIARDFPRRTNDVTGIYTAALNVGTMFTSAFTAPLALLFGWRVATAFWVILAIIALIFKVFAYFRPQRVLENAQEKTGSSPHNESIPQETPPTVWKRPVVWLLVLALGAHLFIYYAITTWLPTFLLERADMSLTVAGYVSALFQILALIGAFGVPALMSRGKMSSASILIGMAVCWILTAIGLLIVPALWPLWALVCGIATGGGFTIIFTLIVEKSYNIDDNRRVSSFVQGVAYTLSALGPVLVGSLHEHYHSWTQGFIILAITGFMIVIAGFGLKRETVKASEMTISS